MHNSIPIKVRWAISISDFVEHKTLFTFDPTDIDTYPRDGYIEFQFSDGDYDDVVLIKALVRAGLLEGKKSYLRTLIVEY